MRLLPTIAAVVVLSAGLACSQKAVTSTQPTPAPASPTAPTPPAPSSPTYDVDALGVPRFVANDYIDLAAIQKISRFRSSYGHDYHDAFESCRSMKHYFFPASSLTWSTIPIYSPVAGVIEFTREDSFGTQFVIKPSAQPAFRFIVFHVSPTVSIAPGTTLSAGQQIGFHVSNQTLSDIAVSVDTPSGYRLISWFDVMADSLFSRSEARGVSARAAAVITRQERDADSLTCSGETFTSAGTLETWLMLR